MKFLIVVISLVAAALCHLTAACHLKHECPETKNTLWATDGEICHVFPNKCVLDNVNCHHRNNGEHPLKEVTKAECQRLCVTKCPVDDNPVCGYYNDRKHTFANQCEMEAHICKTGESLFTYGIGPCD